MDVRKISALYILKLEKSSNVKLEAYQSFLQLLWRQLITVTLHHQCMRQQSIISDFGR